MTKRFPLTLSLSKGIFERIILSTFFIFSTCHAFVWEVPEQYSPQLWDQYMHPSEEHPACAMISFFRDFAPFIKGANTPSTFKSYQRNVIDLAKIATKDIDYEYLQAHDAKAHEMLLHFFAFFKDIKPKESGHKEGFISTLRLNQLNQRHLIKVIPDGIREDDPGYEEYKKLYGGITHFILKWQCGEDKEVIFRRVGLWRKQRNELKRKIYKALKIGGSIAATAFLAWYFWPRNKKPDNGPGPGPADGGDPAPLLTNGIDDSIYAGLSPLDPDDSDTEYSDDDKPQDPNEKVMSDVDRRFQEARLQKFDFGIVATDQDILEILEEEH